MQELLFGTGHSAIFAYASKHPEQAIAVLLVVMLVLQLTFGQRSRGGDGGDLGGIDFGDSDGGSCGD